MPKVVACLFDMDGLLLDSERVYTIATDKLLEPYGKKVDMEFKSRVMGMPRDAAIEFLLDYYSLRQELTLQQVIDITSKVQDDLFKKVQPMPGAIRLLEHLQKHNIPIAIATSSQRRNFELKTSHLPQLLACFPPHAIITGDDPQLKKGKPNPDIFQLAASRLGFTTAEDHADCLVFEDGITGVQAGLAANMNVIWVPDTGMRAFLPKEASSGVAQTLTSLKDFDFAYWGLPSYNEMS